MKLVRGWLLPAKWARHSCGDGKLTTKMKLHRLVTRSRVFIRTVLSREKPSESVSVQCLENGKRGANVGTVWARLLNSFRLTHTYVGANSSTVWTRLWDSCVRFADTYAARLRRDAAKQLTLRGPRAPLFTFVGFTLAQGATLVTQDDQLESVCIGIREMLHQPVKIDDKEESTDEVSVLNKVDLSHLELGKVLAKGCNAVVYSAKWKPDITDGESVPPSEEKPCQTTVDKETPDIKVLKSYEFPFVHQKATTEGTVPVGSLQPYNLAIKMMFNYDVESNAQAIWRAMNKEIVPSRNWYFGGQQAISRFREKPGKKKLPPHPNIVEMHCTFADLVPALPEAMSMYPQALPFRLNLDGCGRNMTLFLVMKRYHCTLQEYLHVHKPSSYTSLLLLTQLLEGTVHLLRNGIAHRDLKTDNILLDLTHGMANPLLAIADFGCCLADDAVGLHLPFPTDEISRGGNSALMAPEVLNVHPGPFASIDYSRADLWAAGAMAYEIYGHDNPFYSSPQTHIDSDDYKDADLPPLGSHVPNIAQKLIADLLKCKPKMRPSPSLAATVCQLLLHGPPEWLHPGAARPSNKKVLEWLVLLAAVTYCQSRSRKSRVGPAEWHLRLTFLSRVQLHEVVQALKYISLG